MTRRVETKGSFAKRQVHAAEELNETALSSRSPFFVRVSLSLSTRVYAFELLETSRLSPSLSFLPRMMHLLSRKHGRIPLNRLQLSQVANKKRTNGASAIYLTLIIYIIVFHN